MTKHIRNAFVSLIALLVFLVIAPSIVGAFQCDECTKEDREWLEFECIAFFEYSDQFDALFDSYETKWSKNNRLMIRTGSSGSYQFVKGAK